MWRGKFKFEARNGKAGILSNLQRIRYGIAGIMRHLIG